MKEMQRITDTEALKLGKRFLSDEVYAEFADRMEMVQHLEECVATNTPSARCILADPTENLLWCRRCLESERSAFEDLLNDIQAFRADVRKACEELARDGLIEPVRRPNGELAYVATPLGTLDDDSSKH